MEYDEKLQLEGKLKRICIQNAVKQGREMLLDLVFPRRCLSAARSLSPKERSSVRPVSKNFLPSTSLSASNAVKN